MEQPDDVKVAQPMNTAPLDGTVVWGRNMVMDKWVKMKFGTYHAQWGQSYPDKWVVHEDPEYVVRSGSLIIPDRWQPL